MYNAKGIRWVKSKSIQNLNYLKSKDFTSNWKQPQILARSKVFSFNYSIKNGKSDEWLMTINYDYAFQLWMKAMQVAFDLKYFLMYTWRMLWRVSNGSKCELK